MSFSNPDEGTPGNSAQPQWLNPVIAGVWLICGLVALLGITDNATYFGFDHQRIIGRVTIAVGVLVALVIGRLVWRSNAEMGQIQRIFMSVIVGGFSGFLALALTNIIATMIDHMILFPASATNAFTNIEAPIGEVYISRGKHTNWLIKLPQIDVAIKIKQSDYNWMLAKQQAIDPTVNSDQFRVAGKYCVRLTIQVAGLSGRLLDSGDFGLPSGSVHICPEDAGNAFARATRLAH